MHRRVITAIIRKDALDLWLNKATMASLLAPIVFSLVWLVIGGMLGGSPTGILAYNPAGSQVVQVVAGGFANPAITAASSAEEVAAAFKPDSADRPGHYALGLVVPPDFETSLRSGGRPQLRLYVDGKTVRPQSEAMLRAAIENYGRAAAHPEPAVDVTTTVIDRSPDANPGRDIGKVYIPISLLLSFVVGTTFVPQLLIEEKEKKTLRMLMVTPATFGDVLIGKLVVVLAYQLVLSGVVLAIQGGFTGHVALVVLYAVLGGCFSVALGLLIGSLFNTVSASTAVSGLVVTVYILAGIFVGPLGELFRDSPAMFAAKLLPTYYVAEGVYNAAQRLGDLAGNALDAGVIVASTLALLTVSAWALRRQAAAMAAF